MRYRSTLSTFVGAMFGAGLLVPALFTGHTQQARIPGMRYVLTEKEAILLQSPILAASPGVVRSEWSADGRYILSLCSREEREASGKHTDRREIRLILWNRTTLRSQEVWKRTVPTLANFGREDAIQWLPGTATAGVTISLTEMVPGKDVNGNPMMVPMPSLGLLWVDAAHSQVKELPLTAGDMLHISPSQPIAYTEHDTLIPGEGGKIDENAVIKTTLQRIYPDGHTGPVIVQQREFRVGSVLWSGDGGTLTRQFLSQGINGGKATAKWMSLNPVTGVFTEQDKQPELYSPKEAVRKLRLNRTVKKLTLGDTEQTIQPLWLESVSKSEIQSALVTADADSGVVSPKGDAVLYTSQGTTWVLPLASVPKLAFMEAIKATIMSNAKQVGLGLIMYAQDYDEVFPHADVSVTDAVNPYVKNPSIFDGFSLLLAGEHLGNISEPAKTQLGTIKGPGGTAIIFADGHVRWEDKKP